MCSLGFFSLSAVGLVQLFTSCLALSLFSLHLPAVLSAAVLWLVPLLLSKWGGRGRPSVLLLCFRLQQPLLPLSRPGAAATRTFLPVKALAENRILTCAPQWQTTPEMHATCATFVPSLIVFFHVFYGQASNSPHEESWCCLLFYSLLFLSLVAVNVLVCYNQCRLLYMFLLHYYALKL